MALPTVKHIRDQVYHDLGIPPAAMEHRDFTREFDARDAQRALAGTGIAVPPLSTYATALGLLGAQPRPGAVPRALAVEARSRASGSSITGASSGIGARARVKIGEAGGKVMLVSRTREKLEEVAKEVEELGGKAHVHPADLSDLEDIERRRQGDPRASTAASTS